MGEAGSSKSLNRTEPSLIGRIFVAYSLNSSPSTPIPGPVIITPVSGSSIRFIRTIKVSPGLTPSMKIGPVAGLTREKSSSVNLSSREVIWPSRASIVSKTSSLGISIVSTAAIFGAKT